MSVPFAEFVGKHAFDGVPAKRPIGCSSLQKSHKF